jgi:hypothetical protein
LPPALDVPANDIPLHTLRDHRGPVAFLAFGGAGRWLASIDAVGYLRIHAGFSRKGLPQLLPATRAHEATGERSGAEPVLAVETRLDRAMKSSVWRRSRNDSSCGRRGSASEEFDFVPGELPAETHVAFGVTELAWNGDATELCAITLTDIHWLHVLATGVALCRAGKKPDWCRSCRRPLLGGTERYFFREQQLIHDNGDWSFASGPMFKLSEAVKGRVRGRG